VNFSSNRKFKHDGLPTAQTIAEHDHKSNKEVSNAVRSLEMRTSERIKKI